MHAKSPTPVQDTEEQEGTAKLNTPEYQDTQHGHDDDSDAPLLQAPASALRSPDGGATPANDVGRGPKAPAATPAATPAQAQNMMAPSAAARLGVSPAVTPSASSAQRARNRIAEYENASATSTPRRNNFEGPAFEVIKKSRKPGDKRSPIADLPNEILTHALAHLSPVDLTSVSLVSHRFHELVTTPHAWRTAFARYFPGPQSLLDNQEEDDDDQEESLRTERRAFSRLTTFASWKSEYILRTRLLRSLARGKPVQPLASPSAARTGQNHVTTPIVMYNSHMFTTVNHIHAVFDGGLNKRPPRFIHGADDVGTVSSSDPSTCKIDSWGLAEATGFIQFTDRHPGESQYGLGAGDVVGVPNTMDVSQPYGMVHGEGSPGGLVYFRFTEEMRGRFLHPSSGLSDPALGIPKVLSMREAVCSVWIAKSSAVPSLSEGVIGILAGSSLGVLTAYSLGPLGSRDQRFTRGETTARWALCPGVPIIAIAVDEQLSLGRQAQGRMWAVVLNALGEVFYLTHMPKRTVDDRASVVDEEDMERMAWLTGRSVYWTIVEPSRRLARPNPYDATSVDGSYSPHPSWTGMGLSKEQIKAETREIEAYLAKQPKDIQRACLGWDMRRRLEVDFAGDDDNGAGEAIVVFDCGLNEDTTAAVRRFTRLKSEGPKQKSSELSGISLSADHVQEKPAGRSLFGGPSPALTPRGSIPSVDLDQDSVPAPVTEEWRTANLSFEGLKGVEITTTSLECSTFSIMTKAEDPLLGLSGRSTVSSPSMTPMSQASVSASANDIPGQRARLVAAGTKMGSVLVWNMRGPLAASAELANELKPVRVIHTDSPQISCLALSSLYLVHGGNDGLVQAWDPLASTTAPIRTLNSRFSSRARRRLVQAQASPQGVGINLFAAGAVCIDPDATVLRGMVSIGTHLRYWSYSSFAADQYKSHKRRLRRSERGSNVGGERFPNVARGNMKDFIAMEKMEIEQEAAQRAKESAHLAGRFGTELLGHDASEEEIVAYATMLSEEAHLQDLQRKQDELIAADKSRRAESPVEEEEEFDADVAEAIRLSLAQGSSADEHAGWLSEEEEGEDGGVAIPIRYSKSHKQGKRNGKDGSGEGQMSVGEGSNSKELSDLEFALQLSLAEEQSKRDAEMSALAESEESYDISQLTPPAEEDVWWQGKGKGRAQ